MHIRKATIDDLNLIMDIYRAAQDFMIESGNPNQWGHFYPSEDLVKEDIANSISYLICDDDNEPHGWRIGTNLSIYRKWQLAK